MVLLNQQYNEKQKQFLHRKPRTLGHMERIISPWCLWRVLRNLQGLFDGCKTLMVMIPKFRIRKVSKGYISEYLVRRCFRYKWVPFITYMGSEKAFEFSTFKAALHQTTAEIEGQIMDDF